MGTFNGGKRPGHDRGQRTFGRDRGNDAFRGNQPGGRYGGPRDGDRPTLYRATCSQCGNACEVPFRPDGTKPVYCRDCFQQRTPATTARDGRPRFDQPRPHEQKGVSIENYKIRFDILDAKVDKILRMLEQINAPHAALPLADESAPHTNEKRAKQTVDTPSLKKVLASVTKKKTATKKAAAKKKTS